MDTNAFVDAFTTLPAGGTLVYHLGHLGADKEGNKELRALSELALLYGTAKGHPVMKESKILGLGLGELTQKKIGDDFEYRFTKKIGK